MLYEDRIESESLSRWDICGSLSKSVSFNRTLVSRFPFRRSTSFRFSFRFNFQHRNSNHVMSLDYCKGADSKSKNFTPNVMFDVQSLLVFSFFFFLFSSPLFCSALVLEVDYISNSINLVAPTTMPPYLKCGWITFWAWCVY